MLNQVADGVWVRQSEWVWTNSIVVRGEDGLLLIDPGIDGSELNQLADDVDRLGLPVAAAPRDVAFAARTELARWQRIAANPIDPGARHRAASVLIRTCEEILAHPVIGATARYAGLTR